MNLRCRWRFWIATNDTRLTEKISFNHSYFAHHHYRNSQELRRHQHKMIGSFCYDVLKSRGKTTAVPSVAACLARISVVDSAQTNFFLFPFVCSFDFGALFPRRNLSLIRLIDGLLMFWLSTKQY